ncbi:hypothetical protein PBRA_002383 [Plasmodiophora brassicae]|uniref:C2 tensin-type domain-containing protein n=1 Tax=Plasmodiophora brassicae TaxID=37360 RepID=A0A0G4J464_PLABS|nr:hypothetical protein PBRA_002383 [Plasmodiophora brassicae]
MFKRQAAPALRQASPRLFFTSEFDWSQLSKDALFDAERCLIICIGDIDAGPHPSVQTSDDNDPYSIVTSVARVAMRWVAADRESTCVVALAPGALPSSVPFEWIVACTACQFTEGASPEECLLALPAKKQSWITRLTSSKAPAVTGRARAFFSAYKDLVEQPGPFTVPILCLRSISIENLPNVDPDRGTRILILVLMNNRIVFSTMQHAGRLSWIKTSGDPACFPVNCMVRGLVTVRAYHVPERMSRDSPRVILFDTDVHTGVAATRDMGVTHQRECMDNVPSSFPAQFSVQVEFSTEPDDLRPAGPVVPEDRTDHSEADDYLLALSLQQMVSQESSPDRHESLSPEARIAPSIDQNASRIGSSQGEVPSCTCVMLDE